MDASHHRRGWSVGLGVVAIVVSVLWTLFWGTVALFASAFGDDTGGWVIVGWVIVSAALALGVFGFAGGVRLVRGRRPSRVGRLVVGGAVLGLLVLPLSSWLDDRDASPVNRAVRQTLMKRSGQEDVSADCGRLEDNQDGSESWICDVRVAFDYDVCLADITRTQELVAAKVHSCSGDELEP